MAETRPALFTVAPHKAFADALVAGLRRRAGDDPLGLARATVLLPNNRAVRAVTEAFVRASDGGLLLPRLVALGDPEAGEAIGAALDPADAEPIPPAVDPYRRRLTLARLVQEERRAAGQPIDAAEAVRLAGELARTLDQLLAEGVDPRALRDIELEAALSEHWQRALSTFSVVLDRWPGELARIGCIDAADRRARLLDRVEARWRATPPAGLVCAAGRDRQRAAGGAVATPGRGLAEGAGRVRGARSGDARRGMGRAGAASPGRRDGPDEAVDRDASAIPPEAAARPHGVRARRGAIVARWERARCRSARARRDRQRARAGDVHGQMDRSAGGGPAAGRRRVGGAGDRGGGGAGDRAQAARGAGDRGPDRGTRDAGSGAGAAGRGASGAVGRRGDDTAGRPLSILPPGTLLLALAEAAAQRWAPLPACSRCSSIRWCWAATGGWRGLDGVRAMDRRLRGPRPPAGLDGIAGRLKHHSAEFWVEVSALLAPIERTFGDGPQPLATLLACLREAAQALCGDALWAGPAGRAAAAFLAALEAEAPAGPLVGRARGRRADDAGAARRGRGTAAAGGGIRGSPSMA